MTGPRRPSAGSANPRVCADARQTGVGRAQYFIEKLVFEVAQRVVSGPSSLGAEPSPQGFVSNSNFIVLGRAISWCSEDLVRGWRDDSG